MSLLSDQSKNCGSKEPQVQDKQSVGSILLRGKEAQTYKLFIISESLMSGLSKLKLKKKIQMLSKKTHFTETCETSGLSFSDYGRNNSKF